MNPDGQHIKNIQVFENYVEKLKKSLLRNKDKQIFYYFSPKTEAFSETHLHNGMAHNIIRAFNDHYEKFPDSQIRVFIATKASKLHLDIKHKGESIFDLISPFATRFQINGSIGIMPTYLRDVLEPNAASIEERLSALVRFREIGVWAESVLCQPLLLPYLTDVNIDEYMRTLASHGIKNIKPEFLTAEIKNLVLIAQYINYFDSEMIGEFFLPYLHTHNQTHIKQRSRLAPDKEICVNFLNKIYKAAEKYGITLSICNWVKRELGEHSEWLKLIDVNSRNNGYRCLGYQTNIFSDPSKID